MGVRIAKPFLGTSPCVPQDSTHKPVEGGDIQEQSNISRAALCTPEILTPGCLTGVVGGHERCRTWSEPAWVRSEGSAPSASETLTAA